MWSNQIKTIGMILILTAVIAIITANITTIDPVKDHVNVEGPKYVNVTQWIFENYDIWNGAESKLKSKKTKNVKKLVWELEQHETQLLKSAVQAECGYNQPDECVRATGDVILNRMRDGWADGTVYGVITQSHQFETWSNGRIQSQTEVSEQVDRIIDEELAKGQTYPGLLFFTAGYYNPYCTPWGVIGDHYFGY